MLPPNSNPEGLTLAEWCNAASVTLSQANNSHVRAWRAGECPTDWRQANADRLQAELVQMRANLERPRKRL